jgi:hypothetical protein
MGMIADRISNGSAMGAPCRALVTPKHLAVIPTLPHDLSRTIHSRSPPENTQQIRMFGQDESRSLWMWRWSPHDEGT